MLIFFEKGNEKDLMLLIFVFLENVVRVKGLKLTVLFEYSLIFYEKYVHKCLVIYKYLLKNVFKLVVPFHLKKFSIN